MYLITLTRISTAEELVQYMNPFPMSRESMDTLQQLNIAATCVLEGGEHVELDSEEYLVTAA